MNHELKSKPFSELFAKMPPEAQAEARRGAEEQLRVMNAQDAEAKVKARWWPNAKCSRIEMVDTYGNPTGETRYIINLSKNGLGDLSGSMSSRDEAWLDAASRL